MDDFLSDLLGEDWDKDDPLADVNDFGSFLSVLVNELNDDDPYYHEVVDFERQYNAVNGTSSSQAQLRIAQNHLQEAQKYVQAKKWSLAIHHLSEIIKIDSNNPDIYLMRGFCYQNMGNNKLFTRDINKVLELDPENAQAILLHALQAMKENFDDSIDYFLKYFQRTQNETDPIVYDGFAAFLLLEDEHWNKVIQKLATFIQGDMDRGLPIFIQLLNRISAEQLFTRLANLEEFNHETG